MWKAKNSSTGSTVVTESQPSKSTTDVQPLEMGPGRSFRNFRFDTAPIYKAIDAAFCP